jgi:small-conductance mechanosensitive channel
MNISEEKQFIYDMMRDVSKERRQLTEIYFGLKERLDDLNKLELRGLEDLSVKGYVDLYNNHNRTKSIENVKRESENVINKINKESEKLTQEEPKSSIPQHEISEQKFKDNNSNNVRVGKTTTTKPKKKYRKSKEIMKDIVNVLKEQGIPMDSKSVYEKLAEKDPSIEEIPLSVFRSNQFYRATSGSEKIERVDKGFYQYKF